MCLDLFVTFNFLLGYSINITDLQLYSGLPVLYARYILQFFSSKNISSFYNGYRQGINDINNIAITRVKISNTIYTENSHFPAILTFHMYTQFYNCSLKNIGIFIIGFRKTTSMMFYEKHFQHCKSLNYLGKGLIGQGLRRAGKRVEITFTYPSGCYLLYAVLAFRKRNLFDIFD